MINLQYHKGSQCICSSTFCQEGYCSECDIFLNQAVTVERFTQSQTAQYSSLNLEHREYAASSLSQR
jgi:hypothetical protein